MSVTTSRAWRIGPVLVTVTRGNRTAITFTLAHGYRVCNDGRMTNTSGYLIVPTDATGMVATADAYTVPDIATAYAMMNVSGRTIDGTYMHNGKTVFARVFDTAWMAKHKLCACSTCGFIALNPAKFK